MDTIQNVLAASSDIISPRHAQLVSFSPETRTFDLDRQSFRSIKTQSLDFEAKVRIGADYQVTSIPTATIVDDLSVYDTETKDEEILFRPTVLSEHEVSDYICRLKHLLLESLHIGDVILWSTHRKATSAANSFAVTYSLVCCVTEYPDKAKQTVQVYDGYIEKNIELEDIYVSEDVALQHLHKCHGNIDLALQSVSSNRDAFCISRSCIDWTLEVINIVFSELRKDFTAKLERDTLFIILQKLKMLSKERCNRSKTLQQQVIECYLNYSFSKIDFNQSAESTDDYILCRQDIIARAQKVFESSVTLSKKHPKKENYETAFVTHNDISRSSTNESEIEQNIRNNSSGNMLEISNTVNKTIESEGDLPDAIMEDAMDIITAAPTIEKPLTRESDHPQDETIKPTAEKSDEIPNNVRTINDRVIIEVNGKLGCLGITLSLIRSPTNKSAHYLVVRPNIGSNSHDLQPWDRVVEIGGVDINMFTKEAIIQCLKKCYESVTDDPNNDQTPTKVLFQRATNQELDHYAKYEELYGDSPVSHHQSPRKSDHADTKHAENRKRRRTTVHDSDSTSLMDRKKQVPQRNILFDMNLFQWRNRFQIGCHVFAKERKDQIEEVPALVTSFSIYRGGSWIRINDCSLTDPNELVYIEAKWDLSGLKSWVELIPSLVTLQNDKLITPRNRGRRVNYDERKMNKI